MKCLAPGQNFDNQFLIILIMMMILMLSVLFNSTPAWVRKSWAYGMNWENTDLILRRLELGELS